MEERRGEFDGLRADRALAEIRRGLQRERGDVALLGYHGADCDPEALADAIETPSLFGARTLLVLRGAEALTERAQERLFRVWRELAALDSVDGAEQPLLPSRQCFFQLV